MWEGGAVWARWGWGVLSVERLVVDFVWNWYGADV